MRVIEKYTVYPWGTFVLQSSFIRSYKVVQGEKFSRFGQGYVHQRRVGCTELDVDASDQIDGSRKIANEIDVHQVTSSRSGLANMARYISRSDGNISEEHQYNVLSEDQFADVWRSRSIAAGVNDEPESL